MAGFLYRLGMLAARRAWVVIGIWAAVVLVAAAGFIAGFGGLATSFGIPGLPSSAVTGRLQSELPEFSGASGTIVFRATSGSAFTGAQREQISALVASAADLPDVARVVDPFAAEEQRAGQAKLLSGGRVQLAGERAKLAAAQAKLDAGRQQLAAAQARLDAERRQAEQAGAPAAQIAALDARQQQLDAQRQVLASQQSQLDASEEKLQEQSRTLAAGARLLQLSGGIRTVSEDGSAALANVIFTKPLLELPGESKQAVIDHFTSQPIDGVEVAVSVIIAQSVPQVIGVSEAIGLAIAATVLLVMLGTLIAAAMPIAAAITGVAVGVLGALSFSGIVQMASVTPVLGVMLGLAVGVDYSLFIINRHRGQLLRGARVRESIALATSTSGATVVFAGSTVVVALLALYVTGIPFLGLMGTVGAASVAVAVLVAITLTPALLSLAGERIVTRRARARAGGQGGAAASIRPMSTLRAVVTVVVSVAALLTIAVPALSMRVGLPDGSSEPAGSLAQRAYAITKAEFGAGANGPLLVTADLPAGLSQGKLIATELTVASKIAGQRHVRAVAPIAVSADQRLAAFEVLPEGGPNSASTNDLVRDLRALPPVDGQIPLGVTGQAAVNIDISQRLMSVLPAYLAVVAGLSLIIMIVMLRSLLVPLIATAGFTLSLFATYGALVAVFQFGWLARLFGIPATGPILNFLPIILIGILFGLAMDYQLFLASGMREAIANGSPARLAVARGFRAGRAVVSAAGLIMVAIFGSFVFSDSTIVRPLGFGLAFGVLIDAFVVRMLFMPALTHILGRSAWRLPRWLDRGLPTVDADSAAPARRHPG